MSGNRAEVVQRTAEIDGNEVGSDAVAKTLRHLIECLRHFSECLVVPQIGEHDAAGVGNAAADSTDESVLKAIYSETVVRGNHDAVRIRRSDKVGLVVYMEDDFLASGKTVEECLDIVSTSSGPNIGKIVNKEDDGCLPHGRDRPPQANCLNGVIGMAETGSIDKAECDTVDSERFLDGVARGAGDGTDYGAFVGKQCVEERRLADIGRADYGHRDSVFESISKSERFDKPRHLNTQPVHKVAQLAAVGKFDILFAEVEFKFEQCGKVDKLLAEAGKHVDIPTTELAERQLVCRSIGGIDEVGDSLDLREVKLAIEEGPLREFSGSGKDGAAVEECLKECLLDIDRTMAGELYGVLSGIGMRCTEKRYDHLIDSAATGTEDGECGVAALCGKTNMAGCNGQCIGTGEAHDGNAADAGRGGNGCNGGAHGEEECIVI